MIKVVAMSIVHPEHLEEAIKLSKLLVESSRMETGCIDYGLYQDVNNPNILTMIETWDNEAALNDHKSTEHVKTIVPKLNELRIEKPSIQIYHPI